VRKGVALQGGVEGMWVAARGGGDGRRGEELEGQEKGGQAKGSGNKLTGGWGGGWDRWG